MKKVNLKEVLYVVPPAWFVSTINPKLSLFGHKAAAWMALIIGLLTCVAIVAICLAMMVQCESVCSTTPIFQLDPSSKLISPGAAARSMPQDACLDMRVVVITGRLLHCLT